MLGVSKATGVEFCRRCDWRRLTMADEELDSIVFRGASRVRKVVVEITGIPWSDTVIHR